MALHRLPDAVLVGGGAIGLATAWEAATAGLSVTVVDPSPGHGASWVAAGMLAAVSEAHFGEERLTRLLVAGAARWGSFAERLEAATGLDIGYRRCGTVAVAADRSDRAVLDELALFQHGLGLAAERLSVSQCRGLVPALSPRVCGGVTFPEDHQVDNRRLVEALLAAVVGVGVTVVPARVAAVQLDSRGAAAGVALTDGSTLAAGAVVVTAGCESSLVGGLPAGTLPPVRPVKGHVLRLRGSVGSPLLSRTVRGMVEGRSCYLVPRADGSLVIGATVEERGFDTTVSAGAVHALLDDARRLVPGVDELELVECIAGLRPGTPDNGPFVGWSAVDRLAVATGHYRNGILLTPITGEAVAGLLAGRVELSGEWAPFDARRHLAVPPAPVAGGPW